MKHLFRQLIKKLSIRDEAQKVLIRGAGSSFIIKIIGAGLAFGVHVVLARLLGVSDYGAYIYIYSWITVLVIPVRLGFDNSLVRFIPEYFQNQHWGELKGILSFAYTSVFFTGIAVMSLIIFCAYYFEGFTGSYNQKLVIWGALAIPLLSLVFLTQSALRGFKKIWQALIPNVVLSHVFILIITLFFYYGNAHSVTAEEAMISTVAAFGVALALGLFFLKTPISTFLTRNGSQKKYKYWLSVSIPMLLIAGMYIILKRTDLIMIGILIDEEAAGVYGAVSKISDLVLFGLSAVNIIAAPLISELYHEGEKERLQSLVTLATRCAFALSICVSVVFIFWGDWVLTLFGPEFSAGYTTLLLLLAAQIANAFSGSVGLIMLMTGRQNMAAIILVFSAVVNIALNVVLVPIWGIEGGAMATGVSMICWNIAMIVYVHKKLNINPTIF